MKLRNKKTGEIVDLSVGYIRDVHNGEFIQIKPVACLEDKRSYLYDTFAKFSEDWEDYKPAEPLIKDPKIRKAVRAWADANDIEDGITYLGDGEFRSYLNTTIDFAILVDEHRFDLLKKSEEYTVTELCGEEEE